ncbi:MAG: VWA domain-containing protein [Sandaracinaceae bacterium]
MSWGRLPARRTMALAARGCAVAVVLASPFAPAFGVEDEAETTVFVVDHSNSISGPEQQRAAAMIAAYEAAHGDVQLGQVDVHGEAHVVRWPGYDAADQPRPTPGTDLEAGVRLGAAMLPAFGRRRLVLLTDGRSTTPPGDALRTARARGVRVDVVELGRTPPGEAHLVELEAPRARLRVGEPLRATARVQGPAGASVTVEWLLNGQAVSNSVVQLDEEGAAEATFDRPSPEPGTQVLHATVRGIGTTTRRGAVIQVSGRPSVHVITLTSRNMPPLLGRALEGAADVRVHALADGTFDSALLDDADLVILADVPLAAAGARNDVLEGLDAETQDALLAYVSDGGGLLVGGGVFGFSPEWAGRPLSRALPVGIESDGEVTDPPVAMAIMLDASGSMGLRVGGYTKIQLAIEGSLAAASTLRPDDQVGIGAVETRTRWVHPLSAASTLGDHRQRLRQLRAGGGGIYVYTALADAYAALGATDEPIRHVVLFADTSDAAEQTSYRPPGRSAEDLAREARDVGISTTVVGIGAGNAPHAPFLARLAAAGGGRYYLTEQGTDLRRIFVTETRAVARTNLVEEAETPSRRDPSPMLDGVRDVPALAGFVRTHRRPTANTALVTGNGEPVLASWRYGLGTVVAFTSDLGGRWSRTWNPWDQAPQLFRQMVRHALRRQSGRADIEMRRQGRAVEAVVTVAEGVVLREGDARLSGIDDHGLVRPLEVDMERIGPRRYRVTAQASRAVAITAEVFEGGDRQVGEAHLTLVATERMANGPDARALGELARLGGGLRLDELDDLPDAEAVPAAPRHHASWPWLLALAGVLVVVDLSVRRLAQRSSARAVPGLVRAAPSGVAHPKARFAGT